MFYFQLHGNEARVHSRFLPLQVTGNTGKGVQKGISSYSKMDITKYSKKMVVVETGGDIL